MTIVFTRHALLRIQQRGFTEKDIIRTIEEPDITVLENDKENKLAAYRHTDKHSLKVVYVEQEKVKRVITVHLVERKITEKLRNIIIQKE